MSNPEVEALHKIIDFEVYWRIVELAGDVALRIVQHKQVAGIEAIESALLESIGGAIEALIAEHANLTAALPEVRRRLEQESGDYVAKYSRKG